MLGSFAIQSPLGEVLTPRGTKAQAALAYLALRPELSSPRSTVMGLLWSDRSQPQAQASLRTCLSEIRAALKEADLLAAVGDVVMLRADRVSIDAMDLQAVGGDAKPLAPGPTWSGELLTNLDGVDPQFDEWLFFERSRLQREYCTELEARMQGALRDQRWPEAAALADAVLRVEPASEVAHRARITCDASTGDVGSALRQYELLRQTLARTLDAVPSPETEELVRRLRAGRRSQQPQGARAHDGEQERASTTVTAHAAPATGTLRTAAWSLMPTVAVLPFVNMSGDPEQQYFSDGITEDLITALARFRTISVVSRTSSFGYRDVAMDLRRVADELGVRFIVEGSVRKLGRRVRITAQLINAATNHHVWAENYDVEIDRLFEIQDEVTRRVVATMVPRIESESVEIARRRPTGDMKAYDFFLKGKAAYQVAIEGRASMAEAREFFHKAVELDVEFAGPYSYLACIEDVQTMYRDAGQPLGPFRERALAFAARAVLLDSGDPHSHLCLCWAHMWRREFAAARKHLDISAKLNPNDADFAVDRGTTLAFLGEPEAAVQTIRSAMRLNQGHRDSYLSDLAEACFVAREYGAMLELAAGVRDPYLRFTAWKTAAYALDGQRDKARECAHRFVENVREIWAPGIPATPAAFVSWVLDFSPFQRQQDLEHLIEGLRGAGLPVA
ncbi:MAG: BTAD domain-containing putative transcriptional regulator [Dongiaceae bacterium]